VLDGLERDVLAGPVNYMPKTFFYGMTYHLMGDEEQAAPFLNDAEQHLNAALEASPNDLRIKQSLGQILAAQGQDQAAELLAEEILADPACNHGICRLNAVRILAMANVREAGIRALRSYLEKPGSYSFASLRHEPRLHNLRSAPGYPGLATDYLTPADPQ
jgi:tetratricopeptide (TPR) repeat protein